MTDVYIKQVIYNYPATIVFWSDGTKTVTKCHNHDVYSKETGLSICVLKKLAGPTKVHDLFSDWVTNGSNTNEVVTLHDVRKKNK